MRPFLALMLLAFWMNAHAQTKFDLLRFSIPAGWQTTQSTPEFRMSKMNGKQNSCEIILFASKPGPVSNATDFAKSWDLTKLDAGRRFPVKQTPDVQLADGWTQYSVMAKSVNNGMTVSVQYTTLSNGKQYINFLIVVGDKACMADIDSFYSSLIPEDGGKPSETGGVRAKKRVVKFKPGKALKEEVGG